MKGLIRTILILMLAPCIAGYADPGLWEIKGEFLYLSPMISQSYYAVDRSAASQPVGDRHNNELDFQSAYRLEGIYTFCNCLNDFQLVWTHLPQFNQNDFASGSLLATQGPIDFTGSTGFLNASSRISFEYFALDALLGFWCYRSNCLNLFFRTGLHYANFNFNEDLRFIDATSIVNIRNRSDTRCIGPELTFSMNYAPYCFQNLLCTRGCLAIVSSLKGALLASKYKTHFNSDIFTNGVTGVSLANDDKRWDLIPFWDMRIGLNYSMAFRCLTASLEIGYEMFSYHNAIDRIFFTDDVGAGQSFDLYSDANFQGPYIALGFIF